MTSAPPDCQGHEKNKERLRKGQRQDTMMTKCHVESQMGSGTEEKDDRRNPSKVYRLVNAN